MELPRLQPLFDKYHSEGLNIIAFEATRDTAGAKQFIAEKNLTYTFLENGEGEANLRPMFQVNSFPTSYLIDENGRIIFVHVGFNEGDEAKLEKEIAFLLGK